MTEDQASPGAYGLQDILDAVVDSLGEEPTSPYRLELTRHTPGYYVGRIYLDEGDDYLPVHAQLD